MARHETTDAEMTAAAVAVEDIAIELKILVPLLQAGVLAKREAYRKLYELRRDLGRVVGTLGAGVPTQARTDQRKAAERWAREDWDQPSAAEAPASQTGENS